MTLVEQVRRAEGLVDTCRTAAAHTRKRALDAARLVVAARATLERLEAEQERATREAAEALRALAVAERALMQFGGRPEGDAAHA